MPTAEDIVREAYAAYTRSDLATMLGYIDTDLEWTYLDPSEEDPQPKVCHGRLELEAALERQESRGLQSHLEEVIGQGERVVVVVHTPGADKHCARKADDRNYDVLTVHDGRITSLRACRNREEALRLAGIS